MKKFIVETIAGKLVVTAENADTLKAEIAARNLDVEIVGECSPEEAESVLAMTVAEIPADYVKPAANVVQLPPQA